MSERFSSPLPTVERQEWRSLDASGRPTELGSGETYRNDLPEPPFGDTDAEWRRYAGDAVGHLNTLLDKRFYFGPPGERGQEQERRKFLPVDERVKAEKEASIRLSEDLPNDIARLFSEIEELRHTTETDVGDRRQEVESRLRSAERLLSYSRSAFRRNSYSAMLGYVDLYREEFGERLTGDYRVLDLAKCLSAGMTSLQRFPRQGDAAPEQEAKGTREQLAYFGQCLERLGEEDPFASLPEDVDHEVLYGPALRAQVSSALQSTFQALQAELVRRVGPEAVSHLSFPEFFPGGEIVTPVELVEATREAMREVKRDIKANVLTVSR